MPESINLVFRVTSQFEERILIDYVTKWKGIPKKTANQYQRCCWIVNGLSLVLYSKSLVIQGSLNDFTRGFLRSLPETKGLVLDTKNQQKFIEIFPARQNSIVCSICYKDSLLIQGHIVGLDIKFDMECDHECNLTAPFLTLNNRVLPDCSVILAKSVSRLIKLGHLKGAEIVFPGFILDIVDRFKSSDRKKAISDELKNLRENEKNGLISINTFSDLPINFKKESVDEDKIILDFAHFTNSVLLTSDSVFRDRALMEGRPTIFITPKDFEDLKKIEETRT